MAVFVDKKTQDISIEELAVINKPTKDRETYYIADTVQFLLINKPEAGKEPVVHGSLTIPFSKILLRNPRESETEFVMSEPDIKKIGREV